MDSLVLRKFLGTDSSGRATLVGNVRNFVKNDAFVNLISGLDINNVSEKERRRPDNIFFVCGQLRAFSGVPGLKEQVDAWLKN